MVKIGAAVVKAGLECLSENPPFYLQLQDPPLSQEDNLSKKERPPHKTEKHLLSNCVQSVCVLLINLWEGRWIF